MKKIIPLLVILLLTGCGAFNKIEKTRTLEVDKDIEAAYKMAVIAAKQLNWDITSSSSGKHAFIANTPQDIARKANTVKVVIEKAENGAVVVVKSSSGRKLNEEYITSYFESMTKQKSNNRTIKLTVKLPENME